MSRFCSLFSSSSGNSTYIGCSDYGILIDAGLNAKQLTTALNSRRIEPTGIKAIFITHEHTDHIGALKVFATRYKVPVYATKGTLTSLIKGEKITAEMKSDVITEKGVVIGDIQIKKFRTSHDSAESCGYSVYMPDGRKISIVTDTGFVTDETISEVTGSDLILLESNHDINMLKNGPYPYQLKQRILSDCGHLSNKSCAETAKYFVKTGTSRLVLGHLSKENNIPSLAYETTKKALASIGAKENTDYTLCVSTPAGLERIVVL